MPVITFPQQNLTVTAEQGELLLSVMRRAGIRVETPCGGMGTCGKCLVRVSEPDAVRLTGDRKKSAAPDCSTGPVLACKAELIGDTQVFLCGDNGATLDILTDGIRASHVLRPAVTKRLRGNVTEVFYNGNSLGTQSGDTTAAVFGLGVDIGTTTVVVALVDLTAGEEIASASALNPQCAYAQDVVSRIEFASRGVHELELLHGELIGLLNELIKKLAADAQIDTADIYEAVFSGNTTMLHLAAGIDPYPLGQYPYTSVLNGDEAIPAQRIGLEVSPLGVVYIPPIISAYIGTDITAGALATDIASLAGNTLFIDIGTNGEMIFASDGKLSATSTAAGPAFEGMNITMGMRAQTGAIERFEIGETGETSVGTIGGAQAAGICGSGLFDIVGELVRIGAIQKSGKLIKATDAARIPGFGGLLTAHNGVNAVQISENVVLTQLDIRQVQLAKAAIRAGIHAMLRLNSVGEEAVDRVIIAGSFGYHLRAESLINTGILPPSMRGKITYAGNTAKSGAIAFLLDTKTRAALHKTAKKIRPLELSDYPDFEKLFISHMNFPQL
ncbi:MAG: ASKHA domain-containing protein [Oscillospiraceae bacterium]